MGYTTKITVFMGKKWKHMQKWWSTEDFRIFHGFSQHCSSINHDSKVQTFQGLGRKPGPKRTGPCDPVTLWPWKQNHLNSKMKLVANVPQQRQCQDVPSPRPTFELAVEHYQFILDKKSRHPTSVCESQLNRIYLFWVTYQNEYPIAKIHLST